MIFNYQTKESMIYFNIIIGRKYMMIEPIPEQEKILSGSWNDNISWEFYISETLPPRDLCPAACCIAMYKDKFVLTRNHRGWEILGGHLEKGETIEDAFKREALEEGGFTAHRYKLFGYRKIMTKKKTKNDRNIEYPFPISYNPHYIAISESEPCECSAEECFERGLFTIEEIEKLSIASFALIKASLPFFEHWAIKKD